MRAGRRRAAAALSLLALAACASPVRTTELGQIDQRAGYRYATLEAKAPKTIDKAAVVLTFSGGGTRAAALADGVVQAMAATPVPTPGGRPERCAAAGSALLRPVIRLSPAD